MSEVVNDVCWIIVNDKGIVRMTKGRNSKYSDPKRPELNRGEYAFLLDVTVPISIFRPRDLPVARVEVPEAKLLAPLINVEVLDPPTGTGEAEDVEAK